LFGFGCVWGGGVVGGWGRCWVLVVCGVQSFDEGVRDPNPKTKQKQKKKNTKKNKQKKNTRGNTQNKDP